MQRRNVIADAVVCNIVALNNNLKKNWLLKERRGCGLFQLL
jgi:hypothetical protein